MSTKTKILVSLGLAAATVGGCRQKANGISTNSGSTVSSVDLRLPDKQKFSGDPAIQAKLTRYQLEFAPTEYNTACSSGETRTEAFENTKLPDLKVKRGCGYRFKLSVGPESGFGLTKWFSGESVVDKATIETGVVAAKITLLPTQEATAAGIPSGVPVTPIYGDTNVSITADVLGQSPGNGTLIPPTSNVAPGPVGTGGIYSYRYFPLEKTCVVKNASGTPIALTGVVVANPNDSEENCHTACAAMAGNAVNCPAVDYHTAFSYWFGQNASASQSECVIRNDFGTIYPMTKVITTLRGCEGECNAFSISEKSVTYPPCLQRPTRDEFTTLQIR